MILDVAQNVIEGVRYSVQTAAHVMVACTTQVIHIATNLPLYLQMTFNGMLYAFELGLHAGMFFVRHIPTVFRFLFTVLRVLGSLLLDLVRELFNGLAYVLLHIPEVSMALFNGLVEVTRFIGNLVYEMFCALGYVLNHIPDVLTFIFDISRELLLASFELIKSLGSFVIDVFAYGIGVILGIGMAPFQLGYELLVGNQNREQRPQRHRARAQERDEVLPREPEPVIHHFNNRRRNHNHRPVEVQDQVEIEARLPRRVRK